MRCSVVVTLLVAFVAACKGAEFPTSTTDEYIAAAPRIEWLDAKGKQLEEGTLDAEEVLEGLDLSRTAARALDTGKWTTLDPYMLSVDTDRVRTYFQKRGFFEVDVKSRVDKKGSAQYPVITIVEGRRAKTTVVIYGLPTDVDAVAARRIIEIGEGEPFDYEKFDDAKEPLVTFLENSGYAHVAMDAEVIADRAHAQATIRYVFDPGPPCAFGELTISGVGPELSEAIRVRADRFFRTGERYSRVALVDTQREIYELGRFSSVRVEPDRSGSETIPVRISVAEANRFESKLGGGFGYEPLTFEVRARASLSAAKVPDPLSTVAIDLRPAYTIEHNLENPEPKIRLISTLTRLDLLIPLVKGELEAGLDYITVEAYTYAGPHAKAGVSFPLGIRELQVRLGWLIQRFTFSKLDAVIDDDTAKRFGLDDPERVGEYQGAISLDLRDDPINARHGGYLEMRAALGTKYAGGKFSFVQLTPEARGFLSLGNSVLALRARLGMILGDVPATERYFTGGASSQRGFSERRLSPSIAKVPIGGAASLELGIEWRSPSKDVFGLPTSAVLFLDGGDVTEEADDLDPGNLHWAAGVGLRFEIIKSVVARLDLGFRLNRLDEPVPANGYYERLALHLGVGQAF